MYQFPIGVILESFRTGRSEAIKKASNMGAKGIQMYATQGENAPENLSASARSELKMRFWRVVLFSRRFAATLVWGLGIRSSIPR